LLIAICGCLAAGTCDESIALEGRQGKGESVCVLSPPGSAAVRRLIETYQPLLSLHGHTHGRDNKFTHIGRTLCCVPGNGRIEGLLSGFLITLKKSEILDFQPIQG
jgi:Icc-related predicted phosphoesterase